jgi:hypothetical protein
MNIIEQIVNKKFLIANIYIKKILKKTLIIIEIMIFIIEKMIILEGMKFTIKIVKKK